MKMYAIVNNVVAFGIVSKTTTLLALSAIADDYERVVIGEVITQGLVIVPPKG